MKGDLLMESLLTVGRDIDRPSGYQQTEGIFNYRMVDAEGIDRRKGY